MKTKLKNFYKSKYYTFMLDILVCFLGSFIYAVSVKVFTAPNKIAPGGFTGISILINYLTSAPIGLGIIILNLPLLFIAYKIYGKNFILKTLLCIPLISILVDFSPKFLQPYSGNPLLAALFGGLLSGLGTSFLFTRGATAGGSDLLAKLLRRKWAHISMGSIILLIDAFVVIVSGFIYKNIESVLYAIIVIFVSTKTVDYVLYGRGYGKMFLIFTSKPQEISAAIISELHRGVSILDSVGAYSGEKNKVLICAVRKQEITKLSKIINKYDKDSFVITTEAGEIFGQGFKIYGSSRNN